MWSMASANHFTYKAMCPGLRGFRLDPVFRCKQECLVSFRLIWLVTLVWWLFPRLICHLIVTCVRKTWIKSTLKREPALRDLPCCECGKDETMHSLVYAGRIFTFYDTFLIPLPGFGSQDGALAVAMKAMTAWSVDGTLWSPSFISFSPWTTS